ncbi:hypothetical protein K0M31_009536 [Melipona bicolor]|uniref:Uncharacterized protein n=1 Tax=Melipona bicolor TaxID=60889 RepID=A0AA40KJ41_9HYME|nr:hypothetical protein K0M31_009536 [Melipona bicolor]
MLLKAAANEGASVSGTSSACTQTCSHLATTSYPSRFHFASVHGPVHSPLRNTSWISNYGASNITQVNTKLDRQATSVKNPVAVRRFRAEWSSETTLSWAEKGEKRHERLDQTDQTEIGEDRRNRRRIEQGSGRRDFSDEKRGKDRRTGLFFEHRQRSTQTGSGGEDQANWNEGGPVVHNTAHKQRSFFGRTLAED